MGIDVEFKQIPWDLLEKIKDLPHAIELYIYAECSELVIKEKVQELRDANLSSEYLEYLDEDERKEIWSSIISDLKKHPEEYQEVKKHLNEIVTKGIKQKKLEMARIWRDINFILTGEMFGSYAKSRTDKNCQAINFPKVNAILGGTETNCQSTFDYVRYFNPQQVKEISKALSNISDKKLEQMSKKLGIILKPDFISFLLKQYHLLTEYYQDASINNNAMLLYLT